MAVGYGVDTYCASSLQTGRLVRGRLLLGQACFRRLITPQGTLPGLSDDDDEASYGLDLAGFCGQVDDRDLRSAIGPAIRAELMKDDRVRDVAASVLRSVTIDGLSTYYLAVRVLPVDENTELELTISVSAVSAELLGVSV